MNTPEIFHSAVTEHFGFLTDTHGFSMAAESRYIIAFENLPIRIRLSWDALRSYEIDLDVGLVEDDGGENSTGISFYTIIQLRGTPTLREEYSFQASTESALRTCLNRMADALKTYGADILTGDILSVRRLLQLNPDRDAAYTRDIMESPVRHRAPPCGKGLG